MTDSGEFNLFKEWMRNNPREWHKRVDIDIKVPEEFEQTFRRSIIPVYLRFLIDVGPLNLLRFIEDEPEIGYSYSLLTPQEMKEAFTDDIIHWNDPDGEWDFNYFMPFCEDTVGAGHYCFDMRFPGEDDLPVVLFHPAEAIPDHQLKIAASFKYWLEKIVKFGEP